MNRLEELEDRFGLSFENYHYLDQALSHASYANEQSTGLGSNERLEFLGDAVLELVVSELLFRRYPHLPEGALTKRRAALVCEATLVDCANHLGLSQYIRLGKGEELSGGRTRPSLLADAFEALVGALYLDQGLERVRLFVENVLGQVTGWSEEPVSDFKTKLQEYLQQRRDNSLEYQLLAADGPDHAKTFRAAVLVNGNRMAIGSGRTKKEAEQEAARMALDKLQ